MGAQAADLTNDDGDTGTDSDAEEGLGGRRGGSASALRRLAAQHEAEKKRLTEATRQTVGQLRRLLADKNEALERARRELDRLGRAGASEAARRRELEGVAAAEEAFGESRKAAARLREAVDDVEARYGDGAGEEEALARMGADARDAALASRRALEAEREL